MELHAARPEAGQRFLHQPCAEAAALLVGGHDQHAEAAVVGAEGPGHGGAEQAVRLGNPPALAETEGCDLPELPLTLMQSVEPRITREVYKVLTVENSVASRTSFGGTAPKNVKREAQRWLKLLKGDRVKR